MLRTLLPIVFVLSLALMVVAFEPMGHSGSGRSPARRHHNAARRIKPASGEVAAAKPKHRKRSPKKRCPAKTSTSAVETETSSIVSTTEDIVTSTKTSSKAEATVEKVTTSSDKPETTTTKAVTTSTKDAEPSTTKEPTSTKEVKTSTSSTAKETASSSSGSDSGSNSGSGETFTGDATFYATGLGACGWTNVDTDYIAAASAILYNEFEGGNSNPNKAPICGKKGIATWEGKSVTFTIVDMCPPCARGSLDFSPSAFKQLADPDIGRLKGMTWKMID